jgi:hypothetical protein
LLGWLEPVCVAACGPAAATLTPTAHLFPGPEVTSDPKASLRNRGSEKGW